MDQPARNTEQNQTEGTARVPIRIPLTQIALPQPVSDALYAIEDTMQAARRFALRVTPAPLVNLNSNINGVMHIAAELAMFKASGVTYFKPKEGKQVNYLTDPLRNLTRAITGADKDKAMQNHWSSRSTMAGFGAWTLGTVVPDKINSQEEVDKSEADLKSNPLGYGGKRLFEAVQIGNPHTKRQQLGLGVATAGAFSAISGFGNINLTTGKRFVNWSHATGGAITALAGAELLFSVSDKNGWQNFGNVINMRIPLLLMSIHKKKKNNDRWGTYALGQALFQGAAVYSYLYGGAQKLADGTIIEAASSHGRGSHAKAQAEAQAQKATGSAQAEALDAVISTNDQPSNKVVSVVEQEKAMPERVHAHEAMQVAPA